MKAKKPRSFTKYWEQALKQGTPEWYERQQRVKMLHASYQPLSQTVQKLLSTTPKEKKE
jgi:hypothetical protein